MIPRHLHLHVADLARSVDFYSRWFGMQENTRHGSITFVGGAEGFDLALALDPAPAQLPPWFHFGFKLESGQAVRAMHDRMKAEDVHITKELGDWGDLVSFRCADPDGHAIEIYWE